MNGIEGYCGSTILTEWLSQGMQRQVPRDVGLVMIHTILPAALTIGGVAAPEKTPIRSWSDNVLSAAARRFASYAARTGLKTPNAIADDDVSETETAWMREASDTVATEVVEHASRVSIIEFHTGLRPEGEVALSSCHPAGTEADLRIRSWFGDETGTQNDGPAILDIFALGLGERFADLALTAAHVEFGTYTMRRILDLDARGSAAERRADMRGLFSPDSEPWRKNVSAEGTRIIGMALENLAAS